MSKVLRGLLVVGLFVVGALVLTLPVKPSGAVPLRINSQGACKAWLKGAQRGACISCVSSGRRYYPRSGACKR